MIKMVALALGDGDVRKYLAGISSERAFNEFLARVLDAEANIVVNGVEVDLLQGSSGVEVKLNPSRFYEGFGQALAMRYVAGLERVGVVHVYTEGVDGETVERTRRLAEGAGVAAVVADLREGRVYVFAQG